MRCVSAPACASFSQDDTTIHCEDFLYTSFQKFAVPLINLSLKLTPCPHSIFYCFVFELLCGKFHVYIKYRSLPGF
jgi:hypothetical protein